MQVSHKLLIFTAICCCLQVIEANVLFRFSLDFHVSDSDNSTEDVEEHIDRAILFTDDQLSNADNFVSQVNRAEETFGPSTLAPVNKDMMEIWSRQLNLNEVSTAKLKTSQEAMKRVLQEILPVVGRSDWISAKAKLINFYLIQAEAANTNENVGNKFLTLGRFVKLVEELCEVPSTDNGGERSLEFVLMKLALEKHHIRELQQEVNREVLVAEESWQRYVKEKLVEVSV